MAIAALIGTTVGYTDYHRTIVIEKSDGQVAVVPKETFDYLYYRLDQFNAALKEDCIEYASFDNDICVMDYPEWFVDAVADGLFYEEDGVDLFYDGQGEIAIAPGSVILRNFRGELRQMEYDTFIKYYDMTGE